MMRETSDKELRARVKLFGNLLGHVLQKQAGDKVFDAVEALRTGFIDLRKEEDNKKRKRLIKLISRLDTHTLSQVVRAFSLYFSLLNIAEEADQHRQRRRQVHEAGPLWVGSFDHTLREFHAEGISAQQLEHLLSCLHYTPVFTAHPTESKRRTVLQSLRRIFLTTEHLYDPRISSVERDAIICDLETQIQILWKTDEVRERKLAVRDEIKYGLFYFQKSLFCAIPTLYRYLDQAIQRVYGPEVKDKAIRPPTVLRFGSWIGGDRDGNPNVKPETTIEAVRLQNRTVLRMYCRFISSLGRRLTFSVKMCQLSPALKQSIEQDAKQCEPEFSHSLDRFSDEPYRRKLYFMRHRLDQNLKRVEQLLNAESNISSPGYNSEQVFLQDLYLIRDSLIGHGDQAVADAVLQDFIRLVETFGFYLLHLDLREESTCHTEAVTEILEQFSPGTAYESLTENQKIELLSTAIESDTADTSKLSLSEKTQQTFDVFLVMTRMRQEISPKVFGSYVISMTHCASHVFEVLYLAFLAKLVGYQNGKAFCDINISPLFETIQDLSHIEPVLETLLDHPTYARLLQACGNTQEIMLGYSDSCKDGGILASAWNLYLAQLKIRDLTQKRGVNYCLFHGRGGTIGRGGGPTHESILAQPPGTVLGQIKFTEQGEVLSSKYSNAETAVYELSMGVTGLMKASLNLVRPAALDLPLFKSTMDTLAKTGEDSYRELIDDTDGLLEYFYQATPANEIGRLNIGSRPSHRRKTDRSKASIRAIAWVFAWAQARHTLPAWYGIGSALHNWTENHQDGFDKLHQLYDQWPFFRALLSNTQMALFKADMDIAEQYAVLNPDTRTTLKIFEMIKGEHRLTANMILRITNHGQLLEENPSLAMSLTRRNPYIDPLNHIQLVLLKRYRNDRLAHDERVVWLDPLLRTINAIAAGMRNTG